MKVLAIYDNNGETLDRYMVVTDEKRNAYMSNNTTEVMHAMLCLSDDGVSFSQWSDGQYDSGDTNEHLGGLAMFEDLSESVQKAIADRVFHS